MSASSIWNVSEADFPAHGSPRQRLGFALKYAALAPLETPSQPWTFRLTDAHVELVAKDDSTWEAVDPDRREVLIGCGAALHHLKLALKHFGCLGRVDLFPDLDEPALVARVHFGFSRERDALEKLLFAAMSSSPADVPANIETPVSEMILGELSRAVAGERGWLEFAQSEMSRQRVMEITFAGATSSQNFDQVRTVSGPVSRWPRPLFAFGGRNVDSPEVTLPTIRPLSVPAATLAVVKTKTDDKHGWVAAGQATARAVLQAQVLGLSWAFFDQVRRREAREALRTRIGHKGFAQVILRFGALASGEMVRLATPTTATATFR